jgi:hypothetical protein
MKMRGLFMRDSPFGQETGTSVLDHVQDVRNATPPATDRRSTNKTRGLDSGGALVLSHDLRATGLRSHKEGEEARWRRAFATR